MDRTPETCPDLPFYLTVEFSRSESNPLFKCVRFIVYEQAWFNPADEHTRVHRTVYDIAQFEDLRKQTTIRRMKEFLRHYIEKSPGEVLEGMTIRGDVTAHNLGDEEVQVTISNVRKTDHTLAMAEFTLRHMVLEFMNREIDNDR